MHTTAPHTCRRSLSRRHRRAQRGSALILVLGLVAITLAVSYAMMRTQGTAAQISANQDRRGDARQAALTGLWVGFRKIHETGWNGPDTYDSAWLSDTEAYTVYYVLGDEELTPADENYGDYPYRLTLVAQGYGLDPDNPGVVSMHEMSAVVQLLPTALGSQPSDWGTMQDYTFYQTHQDTFELDIPYRIEGRVRAQSQLRIAKQYPDDDDAREQYFRDLRLMQIANQVDYRPFTGPIDLNVYAQRSDDYYDLTSRLGISINHTSPNSMGSDWVMPTSPTTYRLYPGGPSYNVQTVSGTLTNVTLQPDPLTNPLGIFYSSGSLSLGSNVTITGSLICSGDLQIKGMNVNLNALDMPGLHSSGGTLRLPAVCCNDFEVWSGGGGSLTGMLVVFDEFIMEDGPDTMAFAITGRVAAKRIKFQERDNWQILNWSYRHSQFLYQYLLGMKYFPEWLKKYHGLDMQPKITIVPDSGTVAYDWFSFDGSTSILARDGDDNLLHWEIVSWDENP